MSELVEKLFAIHGSLTAAALRHAFGGAIALAYCTKEPRGTRDLDVNIFTGSANARAALAALPKGVSVSAQDARTVVRDGQARLWWGDTPLDVFLNSHPFHETVAEGVIWVPLAGKQIPVLDCASLVVFKALFNRTKDWADVEAVAESSPADIEKAAAIVAELLGTDDPICARLSAIVSQRPR